MERTSRLRRIFDRSAAQLALLWAGVCIGVAFVATPAKFLATTLSLPTALEVGRQTFRVYNRMELCLGALALALAWASFARWRRVLSFAVPIAIVLAETVWLLPALDARVDLLQLGGEPRPSRLHLLYIGLEALKIVVLITAASASFRPRRRLSCRGYSWVPIPPIEHPSHPGP